MSEGEKPVDLSKLSGREHQVVALLAKGHRNKDVARLLFISDKTVQTHKTRIKLKLSIDSSIGWMTLLRTFPQ